jgi:nucleoside-diphosphate-sugar epimerase
VITRKKALVVGASGVIGHALVHHLAAQPDWDATGLARRPPSQSLSDVKWISMDLADAESVARQSAELSNVTHVFYAAYIPVRDLAEEAKVNALLLRNLLDGLVHSGAPMERLVLFQGGKVYGLHLGPVKTPMRESDPRHMPPNFYYDLEDILSEHSAKGDWSFTLLRPDVVLGALPGQPLNLAMVIGAYAALCRELQVPFRFPGSEIAYRVLMQATDADLLARVSAWAAVEPRAAGEAYNVTNGDLFRWSELWPALGRRLGLEVGPPMSIRLTDHMRDKAGIWAKIAHRHGLSTVDYEKSVGWGFGDFVFHTEYDIVSDLTKLRLHGCNEILPTESGLFEKIGQLQEKRLIPPL